MTRQAMIPAKGPGNRPNLISNGNACYVAFDMMGESAP